jgi:hypothetical protein
MCMIRGISTLGSTLYSQLSTFSGTPAMSCWGCGASAGKLRARGETRSGRHEDSLASEGGNIL